MPITIHTQLTGQPRTQCDARGEWRSAIHRTPHNGPLTLGLRGLADDRVADTRNHGSPDQAVCCHPLAHYALWNAEYGLNIPDEMLGPGSVGENWTLDGATEADICIGDVYVVGSARVQVSAPRFPCTKQERRTGLAGFHERTMQTMRTGFYLRVLTPGITRAGDALILEQRPNPHITVERVNVHMFRVFDTALTQTLLDLPELAEGWKGIIRRQMLKHAY